jgi:hypothetical protein
MPPAALLSKGQGTLARKWLKLKKRCSSFSSSDALAKPHESASSSAAVAHADGHGDDVSHFQSLKDKLLQWNVELQRRRRRRSSGGHGDTVEQGWDWQDK